MGPLERLIGSLYFLIYIGKKRRWEEKKGSQRLSKPPQSLLKRRQSLLHTSPKFPKSPSKASLLGSFQTDPFNSEPGTT